jgi:hypothetical protein
VIDLIFAANPSLLVGINELIDYYVVDTTITYQDLSLFALVFENIYDLHHLDLSERH